MKKSGGFVAANYEQNSKITLTTNTSISQIEDIQKTNIKLPSKIAIIYSDARREYFPTEELYMTEWGVEEECESTAKYLNKMGIETVLIRGDENLPLAIAKEKPELILNFAGSVRGDEALACSIPAMLQLLNIPSNGSDLLYEALTYNKYLTKKFLQTYNIPVPGCQLFFTSEDAIEPQMKFPVISKLNEIHGSVEIGEQAISETEAHLRKRIKFLINIYSQPVLVENYIEGEEITAAVLENAPKNVYLTKQIFPKKQKYNIVAFDQWTDQNTHQDMLDSKFDKYYEKYEDPKLEELVLKAFYSYKMADIGKFDIRKDKNGNYYIVDLATSPSFGAPQDYHPYTIILEIYGVSFTEVLERIIINILNRYEKRKTWRQ